MTVDKEFVTLVLTIVGSTIAVVVRMGKLATKEEIKDLDTKLSAKLDKLTEIKADKNDVNQRLISIENYLRLPIAPKQEAGTR